MYDKKKTQLRSHVHNRIALLEAQVEELNSVYFYLSLTLSKLLTATEKCNKAKFDKSAAQKTGQPAESLDKEIATLENRAVTLSI